MGARLILWGPRIKHSSKSAEWSPHSHALWPSLVDGLAAGLGDAAEHGNALFKMSSRFPLRSSGSGFSSWRACPVDVLLSCLWDVMAVR